MRADSSLAERGKRRTEHGGGAGRGVVLADSGRDMTLCRRRDGPQPATEEEEVQRWRGQREGEHGGKGHGGKGHGGGLHKLVQDFICAW